MISSGDCSVIPESKLCLTFDDGPGEHTGVISTYLKSVGIQATFFLIGKFAESQTDVVKQLLQDGHSIANHTENHPNLAECDAATTAKEIASCHGHLSKFLGTARRPMFFRPPYGNWKEFPTLNFERLTTGEAIGEIYVGPIMWDMSGDDWWHWQHAKGPDDQSALEHATTAYSRADRGIVLMHDSNFEDPIARNNQTYRMIQKLIPIWRSKKISFISLQDAFDAGQV